MATWLLPESRMTVQAAENTNGAWWAMTPWQLAAATQYIKAVLRLRQATEGEVEVEAGYQYAATDTDEPEAWVLLGTNDGESTLDIGSTAADETTTEICSAKQSLTIGVDDFFIRFGVSIASDTGQPTAWNRATIQLFIQARD